MNHRCFLERKSVESATEEDYQGRFGLFRDWAAAHQIVSGRASGICLGRGSLPKGFGVWLLRQPGCRAMALMVAEMARRGRYEAAAATAQCFVLMLRPSELLRARRMDLIPPALGQRGRSASWSLVLHAAELGVASKVGDQDDSV